LHLGPALPSHDGTKQPHILERVLDQRKGEGKWRVFTREIRECAVQVVEAAE
jgi:hypothetical protein